MFVGFFSRFVSASHNGLGSRISKIFHLIPPPYILLLSTPLYTLFLAKVAMDVRLLSQTDACVTCPSNQARAAYYNDGLSAISLLSCQGPATTPREGVFSLLFFSGFFMPLR